MSVSPEHQLRAYVDYLRDMGMYDFYRRDDPATALPAELRTRLLESAAKVAPLSRAALSPTAAQARPSAPPVRAAQPLAARPVAPSPLAASNARTASQKPAGVPPGDIDDAPTLSAELLAPMPKPKSFDDLAPLPATILSPAERPAALAALRAEIGDCTRCPLAYAGRHNIVFDDGDANARLMFVGEGPGADEDASGVPFVGKAGQLLNNMIAAMGVRREDVYIANIVKCRPPANRAPEFTEATTCSQFLVRQIDIVRPQVIVALGKTAANYLLGNNASLTSQRGQWHSLRGAKLMVTFHPAFLLRDPRQKAEAWKDLQLVMAELGLQAPKKA